MALQYNVTQSHVLRRASGFLVKAHIQSSGAGASTLTLYDGLDASGEIKLVIGAPTNEYSEASLGRVPFATGIYAVISGSPTHASVEIDPI